MSQSVKLKVKGLKTQANPLSGVPAGGMSVCHNVIVSRDDIGETRPGLEYFDPAFSSGDYYYKAASGAFYSGKQVVSAYESDSQFSEETDAAILVNLINSGSWDIYQAADFAGQKTPEPVDRDIARVRFVEANRNLYMTTLYGIKKLSSPTYLDDSSEQRVQKCGVNRPFDIRTCYLKSSNAPDSYDAGFLEPDSGAAYRSVWGIQDDSGNLVLGQPSGRAVVYNPEQAVTLTKSGGTVTITVTGGGEFTGFGTHTGSPGFTTGDQFEIIGSANTTNFPDGVKTITGSTGATSVTYASDGTAGGSPTTATISWGTRPVTLTVDVPDWVTAKYRLFVYRSDMSADGESQPSDNLRQVYEATGITSDTHSFTDVTPDDLRQAYLYSSPNQDGPLQGNEVPPQARDMALFNGHMFYGAAVGRHSFILTFLTNPTNGQKLYINNFVYTAVTSGADAGDFIIESDASLTEQQRIESTTRNFVNTVSLEDRTSTRLISATYVSSADDLAGTVLIECVGLGPQYETGSPSYDEVFYTDGLAFYGATGTAGKYSPELPESLSVITMTDDLSRSGSTVTITAAAHGRVVGEKVLLVHDPGHVNFPSGLKTVATVPDANTFTYEEDWGSDGTSAAADHILYIPTVLSSAPGGQNVVFVSKYQQPEAVPIVNEIRVGSANKAIIRLVPLVDALYVLKEDGIFRITGDNTSNFRVDEFDGTVQILAPESVAKVENQIVFFSNKGVVSVSASGVAVLSRDIDPDLTRLYQQNATVFRNKATAVGYESKRLYLLSLPEYLETENSITYCYNFVTRAWSTWGTAKTFWMVDPVGDLLYGGNAYARELSVERRDLDLSDYQDEEGEAIDVRMRWNVETGGNPDMLKHFREIAVFFRDSDFTELEMAFSTDVSTDEEVFTVTGTIDNTLWGEGLWGEGLWGGSGSSRSTYRFWLPKNKARASQLSVEIRHEVAQEFIAVTGLSVTYMGGSEAKATFGAGIK